MLAGFEQYVRCDTRKTKLLDKCYDNVKNAYAAKSKPPLSNSDHNVVHLIPSYKSVFKTCKPEYKMVNVWTEDSMETLKGCFLCTDWSIFHQLELDDATDTISYYINFCVDNVVEKKDVVVYPNNKPYITKDIKKCINNKKLVFRNRDKVGLLAAQKELKYNLKQAKEQHRQTMEHSFNTSNTRKLWETMKLVTNMNPAKKHITTVDNLQRANELNDFYLRFEAQNDLDDCHSLLQSLSDTKDIPWVEVDPRDVQHLFRCLHTNKATGPDGLSAFLLKNCAEKLAIAWCPLFQRSLDTHTVPALWKKSYITPIPKKPGARENNDLRPVALLLFCSQRRRSHFSLPVLTLIFPALLPCLVKRLSLHCSPN